MEEGEGMSEEWRGTGGGASGQGGKDERGVEGEDRGGARSGGGWMNEEWDREGRSEWRTEKSERGSRGTGNNEWRGEGM